MDQDKNWPNQPGLSTPTERQVHKTYCGKCGKFCLKPMHVWNGRKWIASCSEACMVLIQADCAAMKDPVKK